MNKALVFGILFTMAVSMTTAQQSSREPFDFFGGALWLQEGNLQMWHDDDYALVFSGTAGRGGAGYVIESRNLGLERKQRLILVVSGIVTSDRFDLNKLVKLEINGIPIQSGGNMNRNDPNFLNARNGEYTFDISGIVDIRKINLVFVNCSIGNVKIVMFTE